MIFIVKFLSIATSSENDFVHNSDAVWCDEKTRIVCEIFADEVQKGNRENTHLSKIGYKNVITRFKERTGLDYTRMQLKNKWDKLKYDYGIWKRLINKETGIGWNEGKTKIVMENSWWKQTAQVRAVHIAVLFYSLIT